jgi:LPXTG-motif cell wall-anchored protein
VGGAASLARPAGPALPVTGGAEPSLGLLAAVFGVVGAALVCLARRRHPV